jgi:urease accessory protein
MAPAADAPSIGHDASPSLTSTGWRGHLRLHYTQRAGRTVGIDRHEGPLRVLQPLYPEGPGICHHVLVHPPGGVVGGDELQVDAHLEPGAHALITTPGATRFYRSDGPEALQRTCLSLEAGARLEWLPLEAIAHSGCAAENHLRLSLAAGAEAMGWDVLALGLPAAGQPFSDGWYRQHLELPGVWLERARIAACDTLLLNAPLGWGGHRVLGTLWFVAGQSLESSLREAMLEAARATLGGSSLARTAGATAPQGSVVVVRVLGSKVEPVMAVLATVRAAWRRVAWGLAAEPPRIWRT